MAMSVILDPEQGSGLKAQRGRHGYVARLVHLPPATKRLGGAVVFCGETKRFYECRNVVTETHDYYEWIAVTSGAQRTFLIPVEFLTDNEIPVVPEPSVRTNCFDAIASALNELAIGLTRYNIGINPLCYKPCYDATYVDGKKYYVWNNTYDRAEVVRTSDAYPIVDKPYFILESGVYKTQIFEEEGSSFELDKIYFESTRPIMIRDADYAVGQPITHKVFVFNGTAYNALTKRHLVYKTNEIVGVINSTDARLSTVTDSQTLYDLAEAVNKIIDEVNPFAAPWNNLHRRVEVLEQQMRSILGA